MGWQRRLDVTAEACCHLALGGSAGLLSPAASVLLSPAASVASAACRRESTVCGWALAPTLATCWPLASLLLPDEGRDPCSRAMSRQYTGHKAHAALHGRTS